MQALLSSGRLVDAILVLVLVEAVALAALWRWAGVGLAPRLSVPTLAAGACLLLALRCALVEAGWPWISGWLAAALVAHGADVALRWTTRG